MDYFRNSYRYEWENKDEIANLKLKHNGEQPLNITFSTPRLYCYADLPFRKLFGMNVKTTVYRQETKRIGYDNGELGDYALVDGTKTIYATFISGADNIPDTNNDIFIATNGVASMRTIRYESEQSGNKHSEAGDWTNFYTTSQPLAQVLPSEQNVRTITFTAEALSQVELEAGKGYIYIIECIADPINDNSMLQFYEASFSGSKKLVSVFPIGVTEYYWTIGTSIREVIDKTTLRLSATISHQDLSIPVNGGPLISKGTKYSCYDLLRKALLTIDTQIIDNDTTGLDEYDKQGQPQQSIEYSIMLHDSWNNRLKTAKMQETIFEIKNLWEVLLQIGYYLHAIPYLEFYDNPIDPQDRFWLKFKQLGDTRKKIDTTVKLTVFNSTNLSDYFTQYDSYVTNLFSPQNLVDEWTVCKTSDPYFLVSNDTAELQVSYAMTEIVAFDISMKLPNGQWDTKSALEHIFEKSIYDILSNDDPYKVSLAKVLLYTIHLAITKYKACHLFHLRKVQAIYQWH